MMSLQLKKAIVKSNEIVFLRKKGDVTINISDIERIEYVKPSLINYLFSSILFGGTYPGRLEIHLNKKIGKTKLYLLRIKYNEILKLPEFYQKKIKPNLF